MDAGYDVAVIGLGYIGIPLAVRLAEVGFSVLGFDIDPARVARLDAADLPIVEDGLPEALAASRTRMHFSADSAELERVRTLYCVCVGTPLDESGNAFLGQLTSCMDMLAPRLRAGRSVVLRSTVPLGTSRRLAQQMAQRTGLALGRDLFWAYWPERTTEGIALRELRTLPQVFGGIDEASTERVAAVVSRVGGETLFADCLETAELVKLIDNAYRATQIAFANEMGEICRRAGLDARAVFALASDGYARTDMFQPGLGAGGPCLSKDPAILLQDARELGLQSHVLAASIESNRRATDEVVVAARRFIEARGGVRTVVAVLGLAFKGTPPTDDTRMGAAEAFCDAVEGMPGLELRFVDPLVRSFRGRTVQEDWRVAVEGAHAVLCLTNAPAFRELDGDEIAERTARPLFVADCWHRICNAERLRSAPDVEVLRLGDGTP